MITDKKKKLETITLIGLALPSKTTNKNGQSAVDCEKLWQKFENEKYAEQIPAKLNDNIYAVYHSYEGDHTEPFSYFIGCKAAPRTPIPDGMDTLKIPAGTYQKAIARGKMPGCIAETWQEIWNSDIARTYITDFEVYGKKSRDWSDAEVDIFLSVVS